MADELLLRVCRRAQVLERALADRADKQVEQARFHGVSIVGGRRGQQGDQRGAEGRVGLEV